MDELINIANYCSSMLVKHGEKITFFNAVYHKADDLIEFQVKYYNNNKSIKMFQYQLESFNFIITDTEVLVNRDSIDRLNMEIEKRINNVTYASV